MAGKAYTMREMRAMVEYLTERKAYGEIKGRKMWMEFANSEHSTRTWQSLKETFLKRILPDLHNPYYKLSMDQVRSFRAGYDVAEKEKNNRLEFRTASEDSSSNGDHKNDKSTAKKDKKPPTSNHGDEPSTSGVTNEPPITSVEKEVEKATGEDITSAKIQSRNRSSVDTVVLEYENAEEVLRALESPGGNQDEEKLKSSKDLLIFEYTEPLTPLVRELLDDFETESEASDKEPQLQIVENVPDTTDNTKSIQMAVENAPTVNLNVNPQSPIVIEDTNNVSDNVVNTKELVIRPKETTQTNVLDKSDEAQNNRAPELEHSGKDIIDDDIDKETKLHEHNKESSTQNLIKAESNEIAVVAAESDAPETVKNNINSQNNNNINNTGNSTQNTGNTTSDTILPNNPEALNNSKATQKTNLDKTGASAEKVVNCTKKTGKRSSSQDSRENKKTKLSDNDSKADNIGIHGRITPVIEMNVATSNIDDTDSIIEKNKEKSDTTIIEINTDTPTTNETEELYNAALKNVSENMTNPITSTAKEVSISANEDNGIEIIEDKNPCLPSVSLFDEQFKKTKYSDSDSDDEATPLPKQNLNKDKPLMESNAKEKTQHKPEKKPYNNKEAEVTVVKDIPKQHGILESSAGYEPPRQATVNKTRQVDKKSVNMQRERALANVFGFAHGHGPSTSRKRVMSNRRRSHHLHRRNSKNIASNSSEWTSASDSESYVSPPRGRRYRQTRKYLKPKSTRVLQDPDEGMLYVIFGKKVYPLVKDGKHIKNFLTYRRDSGSDMEEESYWRQKYVEEKKRVDEVKQLLKDTLDKTVPQTNEPSSPILRSTSRSATTAQKAVQNRIAKEPAVAPEVENKAKVTDDKMVLKIASRSGVEYCLEGGWNQISNAMPEMVKMLQSETAVPNNSKLKASPTKNSNQPLPEALPIETSSGVSTPVIATLVVDPEVHEKVNKIETEIFKEIEERDKEERVIPDEPETVNVTKRRGRAKTESLSSNTSSKSPAKRTRAIKTSTTESKQETAVPAKRKRTSKEQPEAANKQIESQQDEIEKPKTRSRTKTSEQQPDTTEKESNQNVKTKVADKQSNVSTTKQKPNQPYKLPSRRASLRLSKQKDATEQNEASDSNTGLPAFGPSSLVTRSTARVIKTPKKYDTDSSASDVRTTRSRNSAGKEGAAADFDSEIARFMFPPNPKSKISPKGKTNRSLANVNIINQQDNTRGTSIDSQGYQDSDFSPLIISLPKRKRKVSVSTQRYKNRRMTRRNSYPTLLQELSSDSNNSSYFIPRKSQSTLNSDVYKTDSYQLLVPKQKVSFNNLAPINEANPISPNNPSARHFNSVTKDSDKSNNDNSNIIVEIGSSSNISLPPSPELSVVENLSISREMIKAKNHPTINELQQSVQSNGNHIMDFSEYMISNLDVSVPLMDQQCNLQKSVQKGTTKNNSQTSARFSDPLLNKVCKVNIENLTLSESLDQRLRDLLLESTKKMSRADKENAMEVDETTTKTARKTRAASKQQNYMEVDEPITATAKKARAKKRSSTPQKKKAVKKSKAPKSPVIEEEYRESCAYAGRKSCPPVMTLITADENANNAADVALPADKVKSKQKKDVIKVKIQRPREKTRNKSAGTVSTVSNYTDSGINDTDTFSGLFLKGTDDSVDLIHNHSETCLLANECISDSVELIENSKSIISVNSSLQSADSELQRLMEDAAEISGEFLNNRDTEPRPSNENSESPETAYHTPTVNSSLITDDLSDDPPTQPTKWYLLSEDDTNTLPASNMISFGANLKQIFPITCAVPDLSTITEMSKENGDSRKSNFDTDADSRNFDPLSLFCFDV